jgi:hypothetical protein
MPRNYGLIVDPIAPEDFILGTSQSLETKYGAADINPQSDWTHYTPATENQDTSTGDTWACVSFGTTNAVEMLMRCVFNEIRNLADRFLAKVSNTRPGYGNSPKTVADALRKEWTVDEPEWPDTNTVEEFYAEIPPNLKTVATARGAEFEFGYQYVSNSPASIKQALKSSPVCIAVTAWQQDENGVYTRIKGISENHWTTVIKILDNGNYQVFDSFPPFIKEVHPSAAQSIAMSYYLNKRVVDDGWFKTFIKQILALFTAPTPPVTPQEPATAPLPPKPTVPPAPASKYDWSNPTAVRHSIRVMCDENQLTLEAKNILTACIQQESRFNPKAISKPNSNGTTDYGLCQYNDGKNAKGVPYWIGKGAAFKDIDEVLNDPEKNVRVMIQMMKAGKINLWSSYATGAYKKWL